MGLPRTLLAETVKDSSRLARRELSYPVPPDKAFDSLRSERRAGGGGNLPQKRRAAGTIVSGDTKLHGRSPAGSTKGAASRILTSITQRQQGHRAPTQSPCTNRKTGGIIGTQCAELSVAYGGCASVCRGRVCHHPFLHCTFLCAYNQIIPLFPRLSRQRDAASPARRGERRKPIAYFAGTV